MIRSASWGIAAPVLLVFTLGALPSGAAAQAGAALTAEEREAEAMGLQMSFACSPRRHNEAEGTTSTIRRATDALSGTAIYFRSVDGTFVALEEYDQALDGHCLVFGWWGDELVPGTYPVARLAMRAMEEEEMSGEHSFYAWGAERIAGRNVMILVESGTFTLESIDAGTISGTFEIRGFTVDGSSKGEALEWAGSFRGEQKEPL